METCAGKVAVCLSISSIELIFCVWFLFALSLKSTERARRKVDDVDDVEMARTEDWLVFIIAPWHLDAWDE